MPLYWQSETMKAIAPQNIKIVQQIVHHITMKHLGRWTNTIVCSQNFSPNNMMFLFFPENSNGTTYENDGAVWIPCAGLIGFFGREVEVAKKMVCPSLSKRACS